VREHPREAAGCRPRGGAGRGIDEIGDAFGLCQVELVVEKRALSEFAGKGEPRPQLEATPQDQSKDGRPAVAVKFVVSL
jgi:hypothetical protein